MMVEDHLQKMTLSIEALKLGMKLVHIIEEATLVVVEAPFLPKEQRENLPGVHYVSIDYLLNCLV